MANICVFFGRIYLTYQVVHHKLLGDMEKIEKSLKKGENTHEKLG